MIFHITIICYFAILILYFYAQIRNDAIAKFRKNVINRCAIQDNWSEYENLWSYKEMLYKKPFDWNFDKMFYKQNMQINESEDNQ